MSTADSVGTGSVFFVGIEITQSEYARSLDIPWDFPSGSHLDNEAQKVRLVTSLTGAFQKPVMAKLASAIMTLYNEESRAAEN